MTELPESYRGTWHGEVNDGSRDGSYPCRMVLNATGGTTRYDQRQGTAQGILTVTGVPLVLEEAYTGPKGGRANWTLLVRLNAADELECRWNNEAGKQARATLRR